MFYLARTKGIDLMFGNSFESSGEEQNDIHWRWKLWSRLKRPNANIKGHKSDFIGIWLWQGFYDTLSCKFNFCVVLEDIKKGSSLLVKFILPTFTSLRNSCYKKRRRKKTACFTTRQSDHSSKRNHMEIIEIFMLRKSSIIEPFILFVLMENIMTTCTQVIGE